MKPVRFRRDAELEFRKQIQWYAARNKDVARRFADAVRRTLELIERFPSLGGPVPGVKDPEIRRFPVHNFPYHVVFLTLPRRISVLAIAHDRRKPGYWK